MSKKVDNTNILKKLLPVLLLVILLFFVVILFSQHQRNKSPNSNLADNTTENEIKIPREDIKLERKSQTCVVDDPQQLPQNWPSDLPTLENVIAIESRCLDDTPTGSQVKITVREAYSYLAFALTQDLKMYGWNFATSTPGLDSVGSSANLEAEKDGRKLTLQMAALENSEAKPTTLITFTEKY